ncbi:MAG: MBL fold metallo-hydrolase, partial [Caulobacterales bacterium]
MEDTRIDEIAPDIYRIATDIQAPGFAFSFNQYLIAADAPMLWHTGPRQLFERTRGAIARVMPVEKLRYIGFSHFEQDECGALNEFLAIAPNAEAVCSGVGAMTSVGDLAIRPPRALSDGERLDLGGTVL